MTRTIKVTSAKGSEAVLTNEQLILNAIKACEVTKSASKSANDAAKAARDTLRDFYKNLATRPVLLAIIEAITDVKKRVWLLKTAQWAKKESTPVVKVGSMSFESVKTFIPTLTKEQKLELVGLLF
jgi:hypothetical protein